MTEQKQITELLIGWRAGDEGALNKLMPLVHSHLHKLANRYMYNENAGHTLQPTALVNEAFLKLIDNSITWQNRAHFLAIAAKSMRQILVDHARAKKSDKRGGKEILVTLHETLIADAHAEPDLLDIEEALSRLAETDQRKADIVELSFYGGMTYDDIAEALGISAATVDRELRFSRAWLRKALGEAGL